MVSLRGLFTTSRVLFGLYRQTRLNSGILLYQMGKVGSKSIVATLSPALPGFPVIHVHALNPTNFGPLREMVWEKDSVFLRHARNRLLSRCLDVSFLEDRDWKLITLVREPLARNLSKFFYMIGSYVPSIDNRRELSKEDIPRLRDIFMHQFPDHTEPARWFEEELRAVFGYDIMDYPFDPTIGYATYGPILILRTEDLDRVGATALADFLDTDIKGIKRTNTSRDQGYNDLYSHFKRVVKFPYDFLTYIYDNEYTRHFYTQPEIDNLIRRWSE